MPLLFMTRLRSAANNPEVDLGMPPPSCDMRITSGPLLSVQPVAKDKCSSNGDLKLDSSVLVSYSSLNTLLRVLLLWFQSTI